MRQESEMADTVLEFSKRRAVIARRLSESARTIPHFYLSVDVDMTAAMEWRRKFNSQRGTRVTVTDLVVNASAIALTEFPRLNSHVSEASMTLMGQTNIGVAVAVDDGLLVPVVAKADEVGLVELSELTKRNAADAQRGVMRGERGTFTVTSLGMFGIKQFLPIINPPECAILAVGTAEPRVVPTAEGTAVREMMTLTLACDHRAVDGVEAAQFLAAIKGTLEGIPHKIEQWL